jgi:hypothetical protein
MSMVSLSWDSLGIIDELISSYMCVIEPKVERYAVGGGIKRYFSRHGF